MDIYCLVYRKCVMYLLLFYDSQCYLAAREYARELLIYRFSMGDGVD